MALIQLIMPKMGESVMEGTVLQWYKKVGDRIEQDESILEVATDKVDTDVPSTHAGILKEILVETGKVAKIGSPIAVIETDAAAAAETPPVSSQKAPEAEKLAPAVVAAVAHTTLEAKQAVQSDRFYSPLVMSIAKEEGISFAELEKVPGTGRDGRLTKDDLMAYLGNRKNSAQPAVQTLTQHTVKETVVEPAKVVKEQKLEQLAPAQSYGGNVEIIEMDRMRKMIAQRMVESKHTSPHVTSFVEADLTNIVNWRNKWKRVASDKHGLNLTFTPIFIEALVRAIQDFPLINSSIDGDKIIVKKDINIGMATALPSGNLIVPVIRNANHLNLIGLAQKVNDLAKNARNNKLTPDDLSGGTYTLSNIGGFGNMLGTPIIMQPQVAIMSTGTIIKKPAVIETPSGDFIGIRHMMFLSHSYDHRIVDGALGGSFVRRLADYLEQFDVNRTL
jgi:2-oxoglutarate dehydrogenase E2 component (dihydrolipoamide succinyltransferase)